MEYKLNTFYTLQCNVLGEELLVTDKEGFTNIEKAV